MFVLIHPTRPDRVFDNETNPLSELEKSPSSEVYQYLKVGEVWFPARRYFVIEDNEIVFNTPGSWEVPTEYARYTFPNNCQNCNRDNFMQGTFCTLCFGNCLDCGNPDSFCHCVFNDY